MNYKVKVTTPPKAKVNSMSFSGLASIEDNSITTDKLADDVIALLENGTKAVHHMGSTAFSGLLIKIFYKSYIPKEGDCWNITNNVTAYADFKINAGDNLVFTGTYTDPDSLNGNVVMDSDKMLYLYGYQCDITSGAIDLSGYATNEAIERLQYYGNKDIVPTSQSDFTWIIENGTATITEYIGADTDIVIPYKYKNKGVTYRVTSIDASSILENTGSITAHNFKTVVIPNSVINIGHSAFYGCTSIINVVLPHSVTTIDSFAFDYCKSLVKIIIPDSVTTINGYAFWHCSNLISIAIPDSVTNISKTAFSECPNLTITCSQGSYAETYAKENNIPYRYTEVEPVVGDLTELETTDKTSIVGAVNEVLNTVQNLQNNYGECEALAAQIVAGEV